METFHWDKNFVTGLSNVDEQHKHLVTLVNQFGDLLSENTIVIDDIEEIFKQLANYAIYHFKDEEMLMERAGVDPRHLEQHQIVHNSFLYDVTVLHDGITAENFDAARHLLDFLTNWLAFHILGQDQNMARQIAAIQSGKTPGEAYDAEEKDSDSSTRPLLDALNRLFEQVSTRNMELIKLNQSLEEKVAQRTQELSEVNRNLEELSLTDVLTGLPNRRHAMRQLACFWNEAIEHNCELVCMMLDADHFKEVNDTYGHDAGDEVLIELAKTLQHGLRNDDIVCRLGGDEFFIICPNTNLEGGMYVAENVRKQVADLRVPTGGEAWHGSISVGIASRLAEMESYEELIKAADNGVYAAKAAGKNCVRTAD